MKTTSIARQVPSSLMLKMRHDLHLVRKAWHMGMGLLILFIYTITSMSQFTAALVLGALFVICLAIENHRLKNSAFNDSVIRFMGRFMRTHERERMSGTPAYLASSALVFLIFPEPVAILAILMLVFGDPAASAIGILWGSKSIRFLSGKSLIGSLGGMLVCALVTFVYSLTLGYSTHEVLWLSLAGGLLGGTAELLPLDMDDNFTIPMVSGMGLWIVFLLMGL